MSKISYKLVFNRKRKFNKTHKALIQVEMYRQGKRRYLTTHVYLFDHQWDNTRKLVRNHSNAEALNYYLYDKISRLEAAELTLWRHNAEINVEKIVKLAEQETFGQLSFIEFCVEHIQYSNIKESTRKNRLSTIKLLRDFCPCLTFASINGHWLHAFENYMLHTCGLQCNTIAKHLNHLKIYINAAEREKVWYYETSPFDYATIRKQAVKRTFLSEQEVELLEQWSSTHTGRRVKYADAFLFCCYCGLRFSDFCALTAGLFEGETTEWLVLNTQKTAAEVRLPLHILFQGKCLGLLHKYRDCLDDFFYLGDNSNTNKQLQRICRQAGIVKHVSFHTARHTFATLLLQQGVNISTVQKLLGHKHIQTTQLYGAVTDRTVVNDLLSARNKH